MSLNSSGSRLADGRRAKVSTRCAALLILLLSLGTVSSEAAAISCSDDLEQRILELTNREREKRGLATLLWDESLARAARDHSRDMFERGFFDHVNPNGPSMRERYRFERRLELRLLGENIWRGSGYRRITDDALARETVESWMRSPGHRQNLLRKEFTHMGAGVCRERGEVRATQALAQLRTASSPQRHRGHRGDNLLGSFLCVLCVSVVIPTLTFRWRAA